jgi:uncharacterized membrane protein
MRKFIAGKIEFSAYFFFLLSFWSAIAFLCSKLSVFINLGFSLFGVGVVFFVTALILEVIEDGHNNKL